MTRLAELQHWVVEHLQQPRALDRRTRRSARGQDRLTGNDRCSPSISSRSIASSSGCGTRRRWSRISRVSGASSGKATGKKLVEAYLEAHVSGELDAARAGPSLSRACGAPARDLPHQRLCTRHGPARVALHRAVRRGRHAPARSRQTRLPACRARSKRGRSCSARAWPARGELSRGGSAQRLLAAAQRRPASAPAWQSPSREAQRWCSTARRSPALPPPRGPEAFALLGGLRRGLSLVAACEHALEQAPEHAERLQRTWADGSRNGRRRGWIVDSRAAHPSAGTLTQLARQGQSRAVRVVDAPRNIHSPCPWAELLLGKKKWLACTTSWSVWHDSEPLR